MIIPGINPLIISAGALVFGIIIMIKSANLVIKHASIISRKRGISEMTIGIVWLGSKKRGTTCDKIG